MRTTLSLDEDVAALLVEARKRRAAGLKEIVNEALRQGLRAMNGPRPRRRPYRTKPVSLGKCLIGNLDDVAEALAFAEGDGFR